MLDPLCIVLYVYSLRAHTHARTYGALLSKKKGEKKNVDIYARPTVVSCCLIWTTCSDMYISPFSRFLTEHWPVSLSFCAIFVQNSKAIYLFKYWCMRLRACMSLRFVQNIAFCSIDIDQFFLSLSLPLFSARQRVTLGEKRATEHEDRKKRNDANCFLAQTSYVSYMSEQHTFLGLKPNEYGRWWWWWSVHSPLSTQKPFEVKMKAKQTSIGASAVMFESETIGPIFR